MNMQYNSIFDYQEKINFDELYKWKNGDFTHIILDGKTGEGKSNTLRILMLNFIEKGITIISRELGKADVISRFQKAQDVINFLIEEYEEDDKEERLIYWYNYQKKYDDELVVFIDHPAKIKQHRINLIPFDVLTGSDSDQTIIQYYHFFKILREMREKDPREYDLLVIMDEANKIMPSTGKFHLNKIASACSKELIKWMSEWRGYHVKWLLTTHSMNQVHIDARESCEVKIFKKIGKMDRYNVLRDDLSDLDNDEYMEVYSQILKLEKDWALFLDSRKTYGFIPVQFISEKHFPDACIDFYKSFECKLLVKPINRNQKEVERIATLLFDDMSEELAQIMFYTTLEKENNLLKVHINKGHFNHHLYNNPDNTYLWGDLMFQNEYLIPEMLRLYELGYGCSKNLLEQKQAEIELEKEKKQNKDDELNKLVSTISELKKYKISNRQIAKIIHIDRSKVNEIVNTQLA